MASTRIFPPPRPYGLTVVLFSIGYVSYFLCKGIFVVAAAPVLLALTPFPNARYRFLQATLRGFLAGFARGWLPALGLYRIVEVSGVERALALGPAVLAANHRGFMDSLLILSLVPRLGVVIKARDTRQLTYSVLARTFDLVSIDPGRVSSVAAALTACRRILSRGRRLLVYPEGTRARSGRLQPFHALAFELARHAGVPVVPVLIHSTVPFMAKIPGSIFPRQRNEYRIRFLDPETPRREDTAESLSDRVHRRMAMELKMLDAGTIWENANRPSDEYTAAH
jgi:1-acyl-sn-glycerol-3-phosphate acyltransferase